MTTGLNHSRNDGYNPNHAGNQLLAFCNKARATLRARLVKPPISNVAAFEQFIAAKVSIRNMDYQELKVALKG
jgi:hypothetical protein